MNGNIKGGSVLAAALNFQFLIQRVFVLKNHLNQNLNSCCYIDRGG